MQLSPLASSTKGLPAPAPFPIRTAYPAGHFFVTLEEFAGFLCIKAMQRIERFWGSCLGKRQSRATIWRLFLRPVGSKRQSRALNSMFCYKLPERAPDSEPPPVSWLVVGCKGTARLCRLPKQEHYFEITKCYSQILASIFTSKNTIDYLLV